MICSNCGAENPTGLKFCEQCATPFKKLCTQCGFENSATARFCGECATSLSAAAPELGTQPGTIPTVRLLPKEAEAAALDGERKTVTALFADIKGSTELMRDLDPEEARAIIDPALKLMIDPPLCSLACWRSRIRQRLAHHPPVHPELVRHPADRPNAELVFPADLFE
jgi:ribosomal protein L40E